MFKLEEQIDQEINKALKLKDTPRANAFRFVKAAIKNERIALGKNFCEQDIIKVLRRELKKRLEAADVYRQGKRDDLSAKEQAEAEIIKQLLPLELTDEQLTEIIKTVINEGNFSKTTDFGQVMKLTVEKAAGQADGRRISQLVKELLS